MIEKLYLTYRIVDKKKPNFYILAVSIVWLYGFLTQHVEYIISGTSINNRFVQQNEQWLINILVYLNLFVFVYVHTVWILYCLKGYCCVSWNRKEFNWVCSNSTQIGCARNPPVHNSQHTNIVRTGSQLCTNRRTETMSLIKE